jgi:hypothetical protein
MLCLLILEHALFADIRACIEHALFADIRACFSSAVTLEHALVLHLSAVILQHALVLHLPAELKHALTLEHLVHALGADIRASTHSIFL